MQWYVPLKKFLQLSHVLILRTTLYIAFCFVLKEKTERVKTWIRLARMTATKRNSLRTCPHYQCSRTRVSPHAGRFETSLREVRESGTNNGTPCRPLIALRSSKPHNSSRAKESSYQSTDNERLFVGLKKKKIIIINRLDRSVS